VPRIPSRKRVKNPASKAKPVSTRRTEAYERLGVTEEEVNAEPRITHILRELPGKVDRAVEFLRGSDDPDARKWLGVYDSLPESVRSLLPFEAFNVAAGITSKRMLEVVAGACYEQSTIAAQLISKAAHPDLIKKSVKFANKEKNWEDRKMLHQKEGFAPIPKTQVVNVQGDVNTDNRQQSISVLQLGGLDSKMKSIEDKFNTRFGGRDEPKQIEGEIEPGDDSVDDTPADPCSVDSGNGLVSESAE
jgi:hypothetical protein